jgi:hypothetical protein
MDTKDERPGRFCKTCAHLRLVHIPDGPTLYHCGYTAPAPWPIHTYAPDTSIGARHVVPGDDYIEILGSTSDWTEVMDCQVWKPRDEAQ